MVARLGLLSTEDHRRGVFRDFLRLAQGLFVRPDSPPTLRGEARTCGPGRGQKYEFYFRCSRCAGDSTGRPSIESGGQEIERGPPLAQPERGTGKFVAVTFMKTSCGKLVEGNLTRGRKLPALRLRHLEWTDVQSGAKKCHLIASMDKLSRVRLSTSDRGRESHPVPPARGGPRRARPSRWTHHPDLPYTIAGVHAGTCPTIAPSDKWGAPVLPVLIQARPRARTGKPRPPTCQSLEWSARKLKPTHEVRLRQYRSNTAKIRPHKFTRYEPSW